MYRKKDLYAIMRLLGKPTVFFTISAKVIHCSKYCMTSTTHSKALNDLIQFQRRHHGNEEPVTCCKYFNKLLDTIMAMLQVKIR